VHKYASGLTSTSKAELFCSCKCRKFIGQNKVKKLVALVMTCPLNTTNEYYHISIQSTAQPVA